MTTYTPRLDLPFIESAQAQKHVTHNEALERLDIMVQLRVQQFEATVPATSPVNGQSWALGTTPTGVWAGHGGQIASYVGEGWYFITPGPGWRG
jgi:hypothetical protein